MSLAKELAALSAAVYLPTWEEVERAIAPKWQLSVPLEAGNSEAMICRRGASATALIWRGTEFSNGEFQDVLTNLGSWAEWEGPGSIHSGYYSYVDKLYAKAKQHCKALAGAPLYVAGHSLGGAAAHIYGARIGQDSDWHIIDQIHSFGAPKAFNSESAGTIRAPLFRHVIQGDFAPKWPPNPWRKHPLGAPLVYPPPRAGMSPLARHWIENYEAVV